MLPTARRKQDGWVSSSPSREIVTYVRAHSTATWGIETKMGTGHPKVQNQTVSSVQKPAADARQRKSLERRGNGRRHAKKKRQCFGDPKPMQQSSSNAVNQSAVSWVIIVIGDQRPVSRFSRRPCVGMKHGRPLMSHCRGKRCCFRFLSGPWQ